MEPVQMPLPKDIALVVIVIRKCVQLGHKTKTAPGEPGAEPY